MNNKNYFIFAAAIALASCSVDEYMGENPEFTQTTKENIIGFGGGTGSMSRATSNEGTTEQMLDKQFLVYGWKTVETVSEGTSTTTTQTVFDNYWVWYSGTATPSNPDATGGADKGWEYVGDKDDSMPFKKPDGTSADEVLKKTQHIKYWDFSAKNYKFVAGSPINSFTFNKATGAGADPNAIDNAEVTGLAGHINPNTSKTKIDSDPKYLAVAKVVKDNYGGAVKLDFTRLQTRVRVGIYETIPGYKITDIEFYSHGGTSAETDASKKNNVTLFSATPNYFNGGAKVKATVTYNWTGTNPTYTVEYAKADNGNTNDFVQSQNWYGGQFNNGGQLNKAVLATSSNPTTASSGSTIIKDLYGTETDMDENGYFTVLSTTAETASPLVIKCDFTLKAEDTEETIKVYGATAAIPAAYCKWDDNKMYTYIFKISQETNGTTGTTGDKVGLIPITFDAFATATAEGVETIVQTPSITTHQTGSVTENGIEFKTGKEIEITVTDKDGKLQNLNSNTPVSNGYIAVYQLSDTDAKTEAELTVNKPTGAALTGLTISSQKATFTPSAAGLYAVQYHNGSAYFYKVIKVENQSSGN